MSHGHDHGAATGDRRILWAVAVNILLTVAQVIGGVLSGSLSLIADALHNFSDAASLGIAFGARRIARKPSDRSMTFGYVRAEAVAALVNYTTLIVLGLYLVYEAIMRFIEPSPVGGWMVVIVAAIALVVDVATAVLTYALSKGSMNIRAAFLHNVADALGSVGVIVAGTLILLYEIYWIDPLVTLLIAGYVLWQAVTEIGGVIRMLMLGTPADVDLDRLLQALRDAPGVDDLHHLHLWAIDEHQTALETHIVTRWDRAEAESLKQRLRAIAADHGVEHTTFELESPSDRCADPQPVGHEIDAAHTA